MLDGIGSFADAFNRWGGDAPSNWLPWRGSNNDVFDQSADRKLDTDAPFPIAEPLVYSTEAEQFFDRVEFQGPTREGHYATLIDALVTAGVWSKLDALYIFAAREEPTALVNLKSSSFTATKNNSPTFELDRGYTGDQGGSGYIITNFNPSTASSPQFVQDSAHIGVWQRTTTSEDFPMMGQGAGVNIFPRFAGDAYTRVNDNSEMAGTAVAAPNGFTLGNRSTSSARQSYKDGASILTDNANTSKAVTNSSMLVLASNAGATVASKQASAATIGSSLTATEVGDFYDALLVFLQAVGAEAAADQTIEPPLFTNTNTFFAPTVKNNINPGLFTNTNTFFGPTVENNINPGLFTNTNTFFGPTLKLNIVVPLFTDGDTFFAPTVSLGAFTLRPSLFTNDQSFFAPTVKLNLNPGLFTNNQSFFAPTLKLNINPGLFTNNQQFFGPTVKLNIAVPLFTDGDTFFGPTLKLNVVVPLFTNNQSFFAPTLKLNILPGLFTNTNTLFPPTVTVDGGDQTLLPGLFTNTQVFYAPTVSTFVPEPEPEPEPPAEFSLTSPKLQSNSFVEVAQVQDVPRRGRPANVTDDNPPRFRVRREPRPTGRR